MFSARFLHFLNLRIGAQGTVPQSSNFDRIRRSPKIGVRATSAASCTRRRRRATLILQEGDGRTISEGIIGLLTRHTRSVISLSLVCRHLDTLLVIYPHCFLSPSPPRVQYRRVSPYYMPCIYVALQYNGGQLPVCSPGCQAATPQRAPLRPSPSPSFSTTTRPDRLLWLDRPPLNPSLKIYAGLLFICITCATCQQRR